VRVICPHCRETFEFSFFEISSMKVICPGCNSVLFSRYKRVELVILLLGLLALAMIFISGKLSFLNCIIFAAVFGLIYYFARYLYVAMSNWKNRDFY